MTDGQENKLSMYFSTQKVVNKYNSIWSGAPAFVTIFGNFETAIQDIQDTRLVQEGEITGVTVDKAEAKEAAISAGLEIATAVFAYASVNNNNTLKAKVDYSPSDLRRSRDTVLIDRLQVIHDEANGVIGALGDYGIDATDLTDFQSAIDAYENVVQDPREAIGDRASATAALVTLFDDADKLLKEQLDKLMEQYKAPNKKFYAQYFNARIIVDLGGRSETGEGGTSSEI